MRTRGRTTEHQAVTCPHCGHIVDHSTCIGKESAAPKPGDVTVCIRCAGVSEYRPGLLLAPCDVAQLDAEEAALVQRARAAISMRRPS